MSIGQKLALKFNSTHFYSILKLANSTYFSFNFSEHILRRQQHQFKIFLKFLLPRFGIFFKLWNNKNYSEFLYLVLVYSKIRDKIDVLTLSISKTKSVLGFHFNNYRNGDHLSIFKTSDSFHSFFKRKSTFPETNFYTNLFSYKM